MLKSISCIALLFSLKDSRTFIKYPVIQMFLLFSAQCCIHRSFLELSAHIPIDDLFIQLSPPSSFIHLLLCSQKTVLCLIEKLLRSFICYFIVIVVLDELDGYVQFAKKVSRKQQKYLFHVWFQKWLCGQNKTIDEAQNKVVNICYSINHNQLITFHAHHSKVKEPTNLAKRYITNPSSTIKTACVVHQPLNTI